MLVDLYLQGRLPLDKFVSETIGLDDVEDAFHKMERGEVLRSVVVLSSPSRGTPWKHADVLLLRIRRLPELAGDVTEERAIVRTFLQQLPSDPFVRDRATIELVAWDTPGGGAPMLAARTPQASIDAGMPRPSECDVVIAVFWGRVGTPLPHPEYARADGSAYESGSVWELEDGLDVSRQSAVRTSSSTAACPRSRSS